MNRRIVDLYAGPGGWDQGMAELGITDVIGVEHEHNACQTAAAAGHTRIRADVGATPIRPGTSLWGLTASPPCQAWSAAGDRKGELDRTRAHHLIDTYAAGSDELGNGWADPRSHHAAMPVRWIRDFRPEWVCLEQVPAVIRLWEHTAVVLRRWGYSTWTGILNAADYGVPQTRERAILIASRTRTATPPAATHARNPGPAGLFGARPLPWVTMAHALGWGRELHAARWTRSRPATTVAGDPRIAPPGHRDRAGGERQHEHSIRVTVQEAAILQSFPTDYPWQGTKTAQHLQVGNAIPPRLAAHIVAAATGHTYTPGATRAG